MATQYAMPPYFTWIVDKLLAVSAFPYHHTHLNYLTLNRIQKVVSFQDEFQSPFHTNPLLKVLRFPSHSLTLNDCHNFVNLMVNAKNINEGVLIHCVKGEERVAVLTACFLIKFWECRPDFAINYLRSIRPSSLENNNLEALVYEYYEQVKNSFENFYKNKDLKWSNTTEFLGKDLDMFIEQPIPDSYKNRIQY